MASQLDVEAELSRIRADSETMLESIRIEAEERMRHSFEAREQLAEQLGAHLDWEVTVLEDDGRPAYLYIQLGAISLDTPLLWVDH